MDDLFGGTDEERPRDSTEGVRIIGPAEAAQAMERGDIASRRGGDQPRYGDRPKPPPVGPRPVLRFPLDASSDPAAIEKPSVRPVPSGLDYPPPVTDGRRYDPQRRDDGDDDYLDLTDVAAGAGPADASGGTGDGGLGGTGDVDADATSDLGPPPAPQWPEGDGDWLDLDLGSTSVPDPAASSRPSTPAPDLAASSRPSTPRPETDAGAAARGSGPPSDAPPADGEPTSAWEAFRSRRAADPDDDWDDEPTLATDPVPAWDGPAPPAAPAHPAPVAPAGAAPAAEVAGDDLDEAEHLSVFRRPSRRTQRGPEPDAARGEAGPAAGAGPLDGTTPAPLVAPTSGSVELPHWTDPPTGEVPRAVIGDEPDDLDAWSSFASAGTPRWRDTDTDRDWEHDTGFHEVVATDDAWRLGAMDDARPQPDEVYSFDDLDEQALQRRVVPPVPVPVQAMDGGGGRGSGPGPELHEPGEAAAPDDAARTAGGRRPRRSPGSPGSGWMARAAERAAGAGRAASRWRAGAATGAGVGTGAAVAPGAGAATGAGAGDGHGEDDGGGGGTAPPRRPPRRRSRPSQPPGPPLEHDAAGVGEEGPGGGGGRAGRDVRTAAIVGVAIGVVAIVAFALGTAVATGLVTVIVVLAGAELFAVLRRAGYQPATLLGLVACAAFPLAVHWKGAAAYPALGMMVVVTALVWHLVGADRDARVVESVGVTLFAVAWVGVLGSFATLMLAGPFGVRFLTITVVATIVYDVVGFAVGRAVGTRPLSSVSPNKTVEGLVAGMVGVVVVSLIVLGGFGIRPFDGFSAALALGVAVALGAPLGDLCESLVKRDLGVKDMSSIIPEHGGVLDRFDGLLFAIPFAYYAAVLFAVGPFKV